MDKFLSSTFLKLVASRCGVAFGQRVKFGSLEKRWSNSHVDWKMFDFSILVIRNPWMNLYSRNFEWIVNHELVNSICLSWADYSRIFGNFKFLLSFIRVPRNYVSVISFATGFAKCELVEVHLRSSVNLVWWNLVLVLNFESLAWKLHLFMIVYFCLRGLIQCALKPVGWWDPEMRLYLPRKFEVLWVSCLC